MGKQSTITIYESLDGYNNHSDNDLISLEQKTATFFFLEKKLDLKVEKVRRNSKHVAFEFSISNKTSLDLLKENIDSLSDQMRVKAVLY